MDKNGHASTAKKTWREKVGLAEMLKGGVIMDVTNSDPPTSAATAAWRACQTPR